MVMGLWLACTYVVLLHVIQYAYTNLATPDHNSGHGQI